MANSDGGQAFPGPGHMLPDGRWALEPMPGMSVRTWLAGQALPAVIARAVRLVGAEREVAEEAVIAADAVLVALGQAEAPPGLDPRIAAGRSLALRLLVADAIAQRVDGTHVSLKAEEWRALVGEARTLDAMGGEEAPAMTLPGWTCQCTDGARTTNAAERTRCWHCGSPRPTLNPNAPTPAAPFVPLSVRELARLVLEAKPGEQVESSLLARMRDLARYVASAGWASKTEAPAAWERSQEAEELADAVLALDPVLVSGSVLYRLQRLAKRIKGQG